MRPGGAGGILGAIALVVHAVLAGRELAAAAAVAGTRAALAACADPARMVLIPQGSFWMGSDAVERRLAYALSSQSVREARWFEAEWPRTRASLPAFCLDRRLVTQAEYAVFVGATGHRPPGISKVDYLRQGFLVHDYDLEVTRYLWRSGTPPANRLEDPVVLVSAGDAEQYCRWRHSAFRLPGEAEWEKGARGADGRIFPWGNRWDPQRANSAAGGPGGTTPADRYPAGASPYGIFDAVGNSFQWTASTLPDGRRVVKGCAWDDEPGLCRPAFRHGRPPESRHILIGFRCAADAP